MHLRINKAILISITFFISISIYGSGDDTLNIDSLFLSKQGGICFRIDDNISIDKYMKIARIFDKYNDKFSISLNFGNFNNSSYIDSIKALQRMGVELMDHTPNHRTNYFLTKFSTDDYRVDSVNYIPGVDHIISNKVCLEFLDVDLTQASKSGICDIDADYIYDEFSQLSPDEIYIYLPVFKKLVQISAISSNKAKVTDVWGDTINLGIVFQTEYYIFNRIDVHLTKNAIQVLANETQKLADYYNLSKPKVWIQPGGDFPQLTKQELNDALAKSLNYTAGSAYKKGRVVYNEYDPNGSERFGMQWGDFFDDITSADSCIKVIADRTAKHYVQINHGDFYSISDPNRYYEKLDSILAWASANGIPVKTYSEWADILYNQTPNPYYNVFPKLNIDRDKNISPLDTMGVPDGFEPRYWAGQGVFQKDTTNIGEETYCYSVSNAYRLCRVEKLAGLEKGQNNFKIKTKGAPGDSIEVRFIFESELQIPDQVFKFPADTREWREYSLGESLFGNTELNIPDSATFVSVDIKCSDYVSGQVKICDMYLAKNSIASAAAEQNLITEKFELNQNYPNPFNPSTKISYVLQQNADVTLKVYDILGREVATLVNENQKVGSYQVNFDASKISSGVYFYTLNAGNFIQTKKMLLLK